MIRSNKLWLGLLSGVLVLSLQTQANADETKGTIKTVSTERNEVVMKGVVRDSVYELNKDAWVCLDGVKAKLADFKEGDKAAIVYVKQGERFVASEIRVLRTAQEASGKLKTTFAERNEVTLKGLVKDTTYELTKGALVVINGKTMSIKDLREGDEIMVTYQERGAHLMAAEVRATRKP